LDNKYILLDVLLCRPNFNVHAGEYIYLRGTRSRSMRSGTELAREIQPTDWSTAGNPSNRSSGVQIPCDICTRFRRYLYSTNCSWIINKLIRINKSNRIKNKFILKRECNFGPIDAQCLRFGPVKTETSFS